MKELKDTSSYGKNYSESGLWDKIKSVGKKAGIKVVYAALLLYYAAMSDKVSAQDKALIFGALGYFILPVDLIPDFIPVTGYSDDFGALVMVLKTIWSNVTPEIKAQAQAKLKEWFGSFSQKDLDLF